MFSHAFELGSTKKHLVNGYNNFQMPSPVVLPNLVIKDRDYKLIFNSKYIKLT